MSKLTEIAWLVVTVVITLALAAPALSRLAVGLEPLALVAGVVFVAVRLVNFYTRQ